MTDERSARLLDVRVARRDLVAERIVRLELRPVAPGPLPVWQAGAHVDVFPAEGIVRQYSIANDPAENDRYVLGVLLEADGGRGGSSAMHALAEGARLRIGMPRNAFALREGGQPAVLLAGGIGITPIKAMAHALHRRQTPFALHYFARNRSSAAFVDELRAAPFSDRVSMHLDEEHGVPDGFQPLLAGYAGARVYICGPAGFIDRVAADAARAGFAPDSVHVERFTAAPVAGQSGDGSFIVEAVRSRQRVVVGADETIAAALERAGVPVMLSCEQGICGTCLVPVLEGVPEHRDEYQSSDEKAANSHMTICCSRSSSPILKLDI